MELNENNEVTFKLEEIKQIVSQYSQMLENQCLEIIHIISIINRSLCYIWEFIGISICVFLACNSIINHKSSNFNNLIPIIIVYIIGWFFIFLLNNKLYKENTNSYNKLKYSLAEMYFKKVEGYDKMDDWVKDKVFKNEILPLTMLH